MKIANSLKVWLLALGLILSPVGLSSTAWADLVCEKFLVQRDIATVQRPLDSIQELHIGTYNVENLFMHLGHHEPVPGAPGQMQKITPQQDKPVEKIAGVAKAILELNLDIVVLQEVENIEALEALNKNYLNDQYTAILVEGNDPRGIDVAFLVKKDLPLDIENHSYRTETWLDPRLGTKQESRIFSRDLPALVVRARGQAADSKPLFVLFGTHLKSKRPFRDPNGVMTDHESNIMRGAQVARTAEIIERYRKEYGADLPIMLAGDFNGAVNQEPEFRALKDQAGLTDAFDVAGNKMTPADRVTHVYFGKRSRPDKKQMDALFVSKDLQDLVARGEVYRYKDDQGRPWPMPWKKWQRDRNPSDHWPVKVTLKFRALLDRLGFFNYARI